MVGANANSKITSATLGDYLRRYDTLFLVDDSREVEDIGDSGAILQTDGDQEWQTMVAAVASLASQAVKFDSDGVGLRFGNSEEILDNARSSDAVLKKLAKIASRDPFSNVIGRLQQILEKYFAKVYGALGPDTAAPLDRIKPLNIIVILTNYSRFASLEADIGGLLPIIKQIAYVRPPPRSLVERRLGIQFVQVEENEALAKILGGFDDELKGHDDVIDTAVWTRNLTTEALIKILVGAIHPSVDAWGSIKGNAPPVLEQQVQVATKALITAWSNTNFKHRVDLSFSTTDGRPVSRKSLQGSGLGPLTDPESAHGQGVEASFTNKGFLVVNISRVEVSSKASGEQTVQLAIKPTDAPGGPTFEIKAGDKETEFKDVVVRITLE